MRSIQLVLDFDDTIVSTSARLRSVLNSLLPITAILSESEFNRLRSNYRIREIFQLRSGSAWSNIEEVFNQRVEETAYLALDSLIVRREELEILSQLSDGLVVCSIRSNRDGLIWQLKNLGVDLYFKEVVTVARQSAQISKTGALKLLRDKYGELFFVGDTVDDFLSAKEAQVLFLSSNAPDWMWAIKSMFDEKS
jgi:phosphoglycolate phosphatase-like HAD superfamily hydrolase